MEKMERNCFWLVDDDDLLHYILKKIIQKNGLEIETSSFYNGLEAIESLEDLIARDERLPCIIFLDINMPVCNGWCFLEKLNQLSEEKTSKITIFICSSSIDPEDLKKAEENKHITAFIEKPITLEKIHESIVIHKNRLHI
jgi:CheY-like chemotaxis protein